MLFLDERRLACGRCHTVNGKGDKVGPDLSTIGDKLTRRELIEAVVAPSATIAVGYSTTVIKTRSGDVHQGVVKEATAGPDGRIGLMGADGGAVYIRATDVEVQRPSSESLMPEGLQNGLTPEEFADLVGYLAGLKLPESAAAIGHGMPPTVPELSEPVVLRAATAECFEHPVWFGSVPGSPDTCAVEEHDSGKIWFLKRPSGPGKAAGDQPRAARTPRTPPGRCSPTRGVLSPGPAGPSG